MDDAGDGAPPCSSGWQIVEGYLVLANQREDRGPGVNKKMEKERRLERGARHMSRLLRQPMHPGSADRLTHALSKVKGWNRTVCISVAVRAAESGRYPPQVRGAAAPRRKCQNNVVRNRLVPRREAATSCQCFQLKEGRGNGYEKIQRIARSPNPHGN
jgi:hypothetical protein